MLCRAYTEISQRDSAMDANSDKLFMNVISMIHERYYDKLTIAELAKVAKLSRSLFIKRFKEICGMPPLEYINEQRIKAAEQMLLNTKLSIFEITFKCGFYDSSHFAKKFIRKNGVSPSEYRKKDVRLNR